MVTRLRLKLRKRVKLKEVVWVVRTDDYFRLRYWWLHELRQLRAKRRVHGATVKTEIKAAQRVLLKIRKEERV